MISPERIKYLSALPLLMAEEEEKPDKSAEELFFEERIKELEELDK